ncbi:MAG: protein-glutamate O-methyltransferase [Magnetococcus sp. WYHC-3]
METITDRDFKVLSEFIEHNLGILMPDSKRTMLSARLQKRVRILGLPSISQYIQHLFDGGGDNAEMTHFLDIVTTNKTDFFREPAHFDYLVNTALPEIIQRTGAGEKRELRIWSAGCSTGEEPYTLAMVLEEFRARRGGALRYQILGTDISTRALDHARRAIYEQARVEPVSIELKRKYLLRSRDRSLGLVRIVPELRSRVRFQRLNFMDAEFNLPDRMDVIFCRNVVIYFDRATQEQLINKFCMYLSPGGYLLMGHSETLNNMRVPLRQLAPTIYRLPTERA